MRKPSAPRQKIHGTRRSHLRRSNGGISRKISSDKMQKTRPNSLKHMASFENGTEMVTTVPGASSAVLTAPFVGFCRFPMKAAVMRCIQLPLRWLLLLLLAVC